MNIINKIKKVQNVSQSFSAFIFIDNQNHRSIIRADDQAHTYVGSMYIYKLFQYLVLDDMSQPDTYRYTHF